MPFTQLPTPLRDALVQQGYETPTPVQAAVIEAEAIGRDLIVSAQTGSGKTVAFGLAMAGELITDENLGMAKSPLALVIAPTRELALQVSRELAWLYAKTGARIATCVGGMDASKERRNLSWGAAIVVGTPGRLRDHLERGALDLTALRCAVLDEADEMLDMGFREDLEQILDGTPDTRRTLLFSATMPRPIVALAKRYQRDALRISTVGDDRGHGDIIYQAMAVAPSDIENSVINLLRYHEAETAMLFCATRDNVRHLHAGLVERGFAAVALSGEHSQNERNHALQALRDQRARVCVATDVAARGIDLPSLSLVIHVETPRDAEILQHRSGRTGRAGKKGTAVLIVPYPRRRRVEGMLKTARIAAEWIAVPTPEAIRARDATRMLEALVAPVEASDIEREIAGQIMGRMTGEEIALALVRAHSARLPDPEELLQLGQGGRDGGRDSGGAEAHHRAGFDDVVWFKMDIGRKQNADPRWILPLLCRRGHITKNEIGAIRIAATETFFQVPRTVVGKFQAALARTAVPGGEDESGITIELSPENGGAASSGGGPRAGGRDGPREPRRDGPRQARHDGPREPRRDAPREARNEAPREVRSDGPREAPRRVQLTPSDKPHAKPREYDRSKRPSAGGPGGGMGKKPPFRPRSSDGGPGQPGGAPYRAKPYPKGPKPR